MDQSRSHELNNVAHSSLLLTNSIAPPLSTQAEHGMPSRTTAALPSSCCCGQLQCAYLQHNNAALEELKKDLRSAAQIGQALLFRHENYIIEAEKERGHMAGYIEKLEADKRELEDANARTMEENRHLLNQLADLNNSVVDADAHISSLTTTAQNTRNELERLTALAARSVQLEAQILELELEQRFLQDQLVSTRDDQRSTMQRWRTAERTICSLQEQIDRIEEEARDQNVKHEAIISRFERSKAVERELEGAAGRLRGAAVSTTLNNNTGNNSVISHFVKDILQDNANLQMGIVELREMLMGSNDEIEKLREQILLHQPLLPTDEHGISRTILKSELTRSGAVEVPPELHVHHHYHPAERPKAIVRERSFGSRRPRNKRNSTTSGILTPQSDLQTLRNPMRTSSSSSALAILSQTSVSIPPSRLSRSSRWSRQSKSSITPSSGPSSPRSGHRTSSIFDSIDTALDSSRPTSPESISASSPMFTSRDKGDSSDVSVANLSISFAPQYSSKGQISDTSHPAAGKDHHGSSERHPSISSMTSNHNIIQEETEPESTPSPKSSDSIYSASITPTATPILRPLLHRSTSHESTLSVHPLTVHPKSSQHYPTHRLPSLSTATPQTLINPTFAIAQPASNSVSRNSSTYNRSLLSTFTSAPSTRHIYPTTKPQTLGKRVGGWVMEKWGVFPMASTGDLRAKARLNPEKGPEGKTKLERPTGVNQKGAIAGLRMQKPEERTPVIGEVDEGLLKESLGEG